MKEKINFICVGIQKSGTSTLHDILQQHPDIALPTYKETHFFRDSEKFDKGIDSYFNYFSNPTKPFLVEIDPEYAYFEECAKRIKNTLGTIKIIFILRNPVDRAYSHYLMTKGRGLEKLSFKEAILKEQNRLNTHYNKIHYSYISRGFYSEQIRRFETIFGEENIQIYFFEDLVNNTQKVIADILEFTKIPSFEFDFTIKSNVASQAKSKTLRDFIYKPNPIKKAIGKLIPIKSWKDKLAHTVASINKKPLKKKPLSPIEKKEIYQQFYRKEITELEKKYNRNLSHWKYE